VIVDLATSGLSGQAGVRRALARRSQRYRRSGSITVDHDSPPL